MTTAISLEGEITLSKSMLKKLQLKPGDDVEIKLGGKNAIKLRRVQKKKKPARRLFDILRSCPYPFEVPPRSRELPPPPINFEE